MIFLTTGQPGAGKTLLTLGMVEELRLATNREVWYWGVEELSLPWKALDDPTKWEEVPDNSIVYIDESWKPFPVRKMGSKVPAYVEALATHRHRGLDLYLVTQDRTQLDAFVRKLVGRHFHVSRKFGFERVTLYQWEVVSDPTSEKAQAEALTKRVNYPKEHFGWYRSAFAHTVRKDFPLKIVGLGLGSIAALVVLGYLVYRELIPAHGAKVEAAKVTGAVAAVKAGAEKFDNPWAPGLRAARVAGVDASAPYYDELNLKPNSQPRIAGCMLIARGSAVECSCTSQQGSVLSVGVGQCIQIVHSGVFDATRPDVDPKADNVAYLNAERKTSGDGGAVSSGSAAQAGKVSAASNSEGASNGS